jgi:hypothetical protein
LLKAPKLQELVRMIDSSSDVEKVVWIFHSIVRV